ncbi:hypothetical protein [Pseudomonas tolaasii]|uniref:hypothetical protein n=1 Tax=Pseudomonas tolaasii TaxID=29442 RepID=UPI0015A2F139|nr:hypothetical protein [Pseudomonas tolaasii]NWC38371.1 hypothetical protein [Pseudomonas tolaasii]
MSTGTTKDWAEAHWSPLTGENTELTQFNIWNHRRFGFVIIATQIAGIAGWFGRPLARRW